METAPQQPRQQQGLLSQRGCRGRSSLCDATLPAQQRCGVQCSSPRWRRLCCRRLPSHHAQPPNSIHKAAARWGCRYSQHLLSKWPRRPWRPAASAMQPQSVAAVRRSGSTASMRDRCRWERRCVSPFTTQRWCGHGGATCRCPWWRGLGTRLHDDWEWVEGSVGSNAISLQACSECAAVRWFDQRFDQRFDQWL